MVSLGAGLHDPRNLKGERVTLIQSCPSNTKHRVTYSESQIKHTASYAVLLPGLHQAFSVLVFIAYLLHSLDRATSNSVSPVFSNPNIRSAAMP